MDTEQEAPPPMEAATLIATQLGSCLDATLSADNATRAQGTTRIEGWQRDQPARLAVALSDMLASEDASAHRRMVSALLIKNMARRGAWVDIDIAAADVVRERLLSAAASSSPATVRRVSIGTAAAVALVDLPRGAWPGLVDYILDLGTPLALDDRMNLIAYVCEDLKWGALTGEQVCNLTACALDTLTGSSGNAVSNAADAVGSLVRLHTEESLAEMIPRCMAGIRQVMEGASCSAKESVLKTVGALYHDSRGSAHRALVPFMHGFVELLLDRDLYERDGSQDGQDELGAQALTLWAQLAEGEALSARARERERGRGTEAKEADDETPAMSVCLDHLHDLMPLLLELMGQCTLCAEAEEYGHDEWLPEIDEMDPVFVAASACVATMARVHKDEAWSVVSSAPALDLTDEDMTVDRFHAALVVLDAFIGAGVAGAAQRAAAAFGSVTTRIVGRGRLVQVAASAVVRGAISAVADGEFVVGDSTCMELCHAMLAHCSTSYEEMLCACEMCAAVCSGSRLRSPEGQAVVMQVCQAIGLLLQASPESGDTAWRAGTLVPDIVKGLDASALAATRVVTALLGCTVTNLGVGLSAGGHDIQNRHATWFNAVAALLGVVPTLDALDTLGMSMLSSVASYALEFVAGREDCFEPKSGGAEALGLLDVTLSVMMTAPSDETSCKVGTGAFDVLLGLRAACTASIEAVRAATSLVSRLCSVFGSRITGLASALLDWVQVCIAEGEAVEFEERTPRFLDVVVALIEAAPELSQHAAAFEALLGVVAAREELTKCPKACASIVRVWSALVAATTRHAAVGDGDHPAAGAVMLGSGSGAGAGAGAGAGPRALPLASPALAMTGSLTSDAMEHTIVVLECLRLLTRLGDAGCTSLVLGEHREWVLSLLTVGSACAARHDITPEEAEAVKVEGKAACEALGLTEADVELEAGRD